MKRMFLIALSIMLILTGCGTSEIKGISENRVLKGIVVTKQADKLEYKEGEELDITGIEVSELYTDSSTKKINITTANITGFDTPALGKKELTITANGYSTTYWIKVSGEKYAYGKFEAAGKIGEINEAMGKEEFYSGIGYNPIAPWTTIIIQKEDAESKLNLFITGEIKETGIYDVCGVVGVYKNGLNTLTIGNNPNSIVQGTAVITKIDVAKGIIEGSFKLNASYVYVKYIDEETVAEVEHGESTNIFGSFIVHQGEKIEEK